MKHEARQGATRLSLVVNPSAPDDLQHIGRKYWQCEGAIEKVKWVFSQTQLGFENWSRKPEFAAGAGVTATLEGYSCSVCDGPLECPTRHVVKSVLKDRKPGKCRCCTQGFQEKVDLVFDPDYHAECVAREAQKREEAAQRKAQKRRIEELERERRDVLLEINENSLAGSLEETIEESSILAKVGALLWLRLQDGIPLEENELTIFLMEQAWTSGLLAVPHFADLNAFQWREDEPTVLERIKKIPVFILGFSSPSSRMGEEKRIYRILMEKLSKQRLSKDDTEKIRWLIAQIRVRETLDALRVAGSNLEWRILSFESTGAFRDEIEAAIRLTQDTVSQRDLLVAAQSSVYQAFEAYRDEPFEIRLDDDVSEQLLINLQRLQHGQNVQGHKDVDVDSHLPASLTRLVFLQALGLAPFAASTTPQAIERALMERFIPATQQ